MEQIKRMSYRQKRKAQRIRMMMKVGAVTASLALVFLVFIIFGGAKKLQTFIRAEEKSSNSLLRNVAVVSEHTLERYEIQDISLAPAIEEELFPSCTFVSKTFYTLDEQRPWDFVNLENYPYDCYMSFVDAPDYTKAGVQKISIAVSGLGNKPVIISGEVKLIEDKVAPVIEGVEEIVVEINAAISYKKGVTAIDDRDGEIEFTVECDEVDTSTLGVYYATYIAEDSYGNIGTEPVKISVVERFISEEELNVLGQEILDNIIKEDMTDFKKVEAIYSWCHDNIKYTGTSDKVAWQYAAYDGLKKRSGDCYTICSVVKLMLDLSGYENIIVERIPWQDRHHWWNMVDIGDGWYHIDATPHNRNHLFYSFMRTTDEMIAYSQSYKAYYYDFDHSKYPTSATESYYD